MKKLTTLIAIGLVVGALAGCGGSSPTGVQSASSSQAVNQGTPEDRAAVMAEAVLHPEFMEDNVYQSDAADQIAGKVGGLGVEAAIEPITFWRRARVADKHFEFAFADTDSTGRPHSATLTVMKDLVGTFKILVADTSGSFNDPVRIEKPLAETWTRRLDFDRRARDHDDDDDDDEDDDDDDVNNIHGDRDDDDDDDDDGRGRGRWELAGVSGIEISSLEGATEIVSLRLQSPEMDTTISDILQLFELESLPLLEPESEVTITVTTLASDDIVLLLARDRRVRLHSTGGNTYSGTFTVPSSSGCHHFGVSAISHNTLYDDTAPYDSETWILPVVSRGWRIASAN